MKKVKKLIILVCCIVLSVCGCDKTKRYEKLKITSDQFGRMTRIFELETLECKYHNVARSVKTKKFGLIKKKKTFLVEYDSVANIFYDLSKMDYLIDDDKKIIYVKLPTPSVETRVVEGSFSKIKESANNRFFKISIDSSDIQEAIDNSEEDMKKEIKENASLFGSASAQAEIIIRNFVDQINRMNNNNYTVQVVEELDKNVEDSTIETHK